MSAAKYPTAAKAAVGYLAFTPFSHPWSTLRRTPTKGGVDRKPKRPQEWGPKGGEREIRGAL